MIRIYLRFPSFFSSSINTNRMFETFSFLPPLSDADLTKQVQYLLNNGWTPCLDLEDPPTPTLTATAGLVWTPPSTPTTTTTDTGSCGSCRCTVATTPTKSSKKSRRASRRSRTATSDARLRQHQASAMCWLLVLQTEVGPDGRWCQTSR